MMSERDAREMVSVIGVRNRLLRAIKLLKQPLRSQQPLLSRSRSTSRTATPNSRKRFPSTGVSRQTTDGNQLPSNISQITNNITTSGLDVAYVRERKRKEQQRQSERLTNYQTERERWVSLLQRTVQHPNHGPDDATLQKRKDLQKKEESYRRSLSSSMRKYKNQQFVSTDDRKTPSSMRRIVFSSNNNNSNRSSSSGINKRILLNINSVNETDHPSAEFGSDLYENIKTAYSSLKQPTNPEAEPTQRTRVWSRKTAQKQQLSTPLVPPTPAATILTPSVPTPTAPAASSECSPSPPPPVGSPSLLHISNSPTLLNSNSPHSSPYRHPPQQARSPSPFNTTPVIEERSVEQEEVCYSAFFITETD